MLSQYTTKPTRFKMSKDTDSMTVTVKLTKEHRELMDTWLNYGDLFSYGCIGYWAHGAARDDALGWLVWDQAAEDDHPTEAQQEEAETLWRHGEPLPARWYRLDKAAAVLAIKYHIEQYGIDFWSHLDADTEDNAIQTVLLGEVVYG